MISPIPRNYYVFREATTVEELKALLQLRYRGYHQSRCTNIIDKNESGLDLDYYDLQSKHMGFFQLKGKETIPLGYMRLIEDDLTNAAPMIWELAEEHPELVEKLKEKPESPLPFLSISPDSKAINDFYNKACADGKKIVEGSRFVFDKSVRSRGFPKFVLESAVAITLFSQDFEYAMLGCLPRHGSFYSLFGFEPFSGYEDFPYGALRSCILKNTKESIPDKIRSKIEKMAATFCQTGILCHFPENANLFHMPKENHRLVPEKRTLAKAG